MNQPHLITELLDAFVSGSSSPGEDAELRAHVKTCPACAARLAEFARTEEAMAPLARTPRPPPRRARRIAVGVALMAASLALAVLGARLPRTPAAALQVSAGIPAVNCPDGPDQRGCVASALRMGLIVEYPPFVGGPPVGAAPLVGMAPLVVHEWQLE